MLFAAHDTGGANMLAPVMPMMAAAGHQVAQVSAGPGRSVWGTEFLLTPEVEPPPLLECIERFGPQILVTGTSFHANFEKTLWAMIGRGIPYVAVVDTWSHFEQRFTLDDQKILLPDGICVVDEWCAMTLRESGWCNSRIYVTGNPHLEMVARRVQNARRVRSADSGERLVVYFSEPLLEEHPEGVPIPFSQFEVADLLAQVVRACSAAILVVKPHPREDPTRWQEWANAESHRSRVRIETGGMTTEQLLAAAHIVTGVTTMVLLEAAFAGVLTVSLQPGRERVYHPMLEIIGSIRVVTQESAVAPLIREMIAGAYPPIDPSAEAALPPMNAARSIAQAVEAEFRISRNQISEFRNATDLGLEGA